MHAAQLAKANAKKFAKANNLMHKQIAPKAKANLNAFAPWVVIAPIKAIKTPVMHYVVNNKFALAMQYGEVNNRLNTRTYYAVFNCLLKANAYLAANKMQLFATVVTQ